MCVCVCVCVGCCISNCILGPRLSTDWGEGGDSLCSSNRYRNRNRNWAAAARSVCPRASWQAIPRRPKTKDQDQDQDQDPDCSSDSVSDSLGLSVGWRPFPGRSKSIFLHRIKCALCRFWFFVASSAYKPNRNAPETIIRTQSQTPTQTLTKTIAICILYSNYLCNLPHCAP